MKVYIPFNMIVDTDFGIVRILENMNKIPEYSANQIKSFLLKRYNINVIPEYSMLRDISADEYLYDMILQNFYDKLLPVSGLTDMVSFIINTYKLGLYNDVNIMVGCNYDSEIEYLKSILSSIDYDIDMSLNMDINLNDYDCIFTKYIDEFYVDHLVNRVKIKGKRIYVADYNFNTLYDDETNERIINPLLQIPLEANGNIVHLVSLYNKK